ncbi:MAG TPA: rhodanese-like domain-containing protein [Chromatiaceae bacterium]|jgi:hydroxyacylglutathione hydrolase|nr:rhodanese-like domain-containing protein [Chromatiaceae bacterium]HIN81332.1 rhodanese-like domain-containing protein [Chromatiales bacterium]HIO13933.1 rhodanese-like domain-containing protein [Chromatiales bacterium]HIO54681.1 rhodanese-like domain-containing protein [Chromatiales bacterium]
MIMRLSNWLTVVSLSLMIIFPVHASEDSEINSAELAEMIAAGNAPAIVDTRSTFEYEAGHIPGAIHIPFWTTLWNSDKIVASGHDPVVVYCAHGPRAYAAGMMLGLKGFPNVVYLNGHMSGWSKAKLPETVGSEP